MANSAYTTKINGFVPLRTITTINDFIPLITITTINNCSNTIPTSTTCTYRTSNDFNNINNKDFGSRAKVEVDFSEPGPISAVSTSQSTTTTINDSTIND